MSRNENRTGLPEGLVFPVPEENPPNTLVPSESGGLNWSMPTDFVELPSKGLLYPSGHPLRGVETIEMRYMPAKEEDLLTSQALLKKGIALDRVLENLIVDKTISLNSMLSGDKSALVIGARITGYGADYEFEQACPRCGEINEVSYDLTEFRAIPFEENMAAANLTPTENGTFEVVLPMSKAPVEIRFLTGADEKKSHKERQRKNTKKLGETSTTSFLRQIIVAIDGNSDAVVIAQFVNQMPARDSRFLRSLYNDVNPRVDFSEIFTCSSCNYQADMEVPLNATFFWPQ